MDKEAVMEIIRRFIDENDIWCAETICQTDRVMANAPEFIEELCNIVGYKEDNDND